MQIESKYKLATAKEVEALGGKEYMWKCFHNRGWWVQGADKECGICKLKMPEELLEILTDPNTKKEKYYGIRQ